MVKILAIIAALLGFAATKPDTFRVERATSINAPPEKIFALITDLHSWGAWSTWETKDPAMQRTYSGAATGKGAVYEWDGNRNIGKGRMEIVDTPTPSKVVIKLDFITPFEGHNIAEFTLAPKGSSTDVTWAIHGPNRYIGKVMSLFFSMDSMIGKEFETGLANLKTVAEA
jgi:uncharacterized protein YndB with AHSA1/START domain